MIMGDVTKDLRMLAEKRGLKCDHGYSVGGKIVNEDTVTTVWPLPRARSKTLTFMEDNGKLYCDDGLTVEQAFSCILVAMAGGEVW